MQTNEVSASAVKAWFSSQNTIHIPSSVDFVCSTCKMLSNHVLQDQTVTSFKFSGKWSATCVFRCVRCDKRHLLWSTGLSMNAATVTALYVHPAPAITKTRGFEEFDAGVVPERILRVYKDAVRSFDAQIWDGTATLCGKTLEGVIKDKLTAAQMSKGEPPKDVKTLGKQLKAINSELDLSEPFNRLSEAIQQGRNIGAHFDATIETDEAMASALLDLVEHVLEFIYVFEHKAETLKARILELSSSEEESTAQPVGEPTEQETEQA